MKYSQRAWIKDYDQTGSGASSIGTMIDTLSQLRQTHEFHSWLGEHLRECKAIAS
ncbi:hypothetical protein [Acinetobacter sp. ANC 4633]|uniref:hypothetical protein n=1 Tax=Acinetobacter sp. ANC 4633 TaxID=2529845 RepID=UPI0013F14CD0|nr:hypothetical protein [Acinetobacter sp. ANC 4633]